MSNLFELLRMNESDVIKEPPSTTETMTDHNYRQQHQQQNTELVTSMLPVSHSKSLDDLVTSYVSMNPVTPLQMAVSVTSSSSDAAPSTEKTSPHDDMGSSINTYSRGASQRRGTEDELDFGITAQNQKYDLPRCYMPSYDDLKSMETFVTNAFLAHEQNENLKRQRKAELSSNSKCVSDVAGHPSPSASAEDEKATTTTTMNNVNPAHLQGYQGLIRILVRPDDPILLRRIFVALRTAGHGSVLQRLSLNEDHAKMSHLIFRFGSTRPSDQLIKEVLEYRASVTMSSSGEQETGGETAPLDLTSSDGLPSQLVEKLKVYDDYSLCDAHFHLLLGIVSTRPTRSKPLLTAIWKLLTKVPNQPEALTHRLHSMLHTTLRLVPKTKNDLFPIMQARFPFWRWPKEILLWYVTQSFRVLEYLPSLRSQVFEMIIISCLELDVNILIKDNGSVTFDESEEQIKANMAKEAEIQEEDRETADAWKTSNDESIDEVSDKLDAILEMLFVKLQSFADHDVRTARRVFRDLLPTFERSVLPTHKAKFVQFCMFLSCALEARAAAMSEANSIVNKSGVNLPPVTPEPPVGDDDDDHGETILDREFAAKLIEIIVDPYRATTTRQSSACYLASFVSRATFVKVDTVCESISTLLSWAEAYIEALGPNAIRAADARRQGDLHALFYTACQAAFYIMSFRGKEAISYYRAMLSNDTQANQDLDGTTVDGIDLSCKRWTFLCGHPLQPLRICLESVRSEFLHVAHFYDLIDEPVMNRLVADAKRISSGRVNKKAASTISTAATLQLKRQNGGVGGLGHGSNPLKTFFPFDPLLLRRTYEFIEPIYRNWGGPVEEEDVLIIDDGPGEGILDENKDEFPDEGSDVDDDDDDDEDEGVFEMEEDQQRDESKLASDANDDSDEEDTERESVNRTDSRDNKFGVSSMRQQRFQLQLSPLQRDDDGDDEDATSVGENYRARSGTLSTINSDPETNERDPIYGTPQKSLTAADQKARQMKAWTDATSKAKKKRPRSTSMDGSW